VTLAQLLRHILINQCVVLSGSYGYNAWEFTGADMDEDEEDSADMDEDEQEGDEDSAQQKKKQFGFTKHYDPVALKVICDNLFFNLLLVCGRDIGCRLPSEDAIRA